MGATHQSIVPTVDEQAIILSSRFKRPIDSAKPERIIGEFWSPEGGGKTHFAGTAPGPVWFANFDQGIEDIAFRIPGAKHIFGETYMADSFDLTPDEAAEIKTRFEEDVRWVMRNMKRGTFVIDTASELNQILQKWLIWKVQQNGRTPKAGKTGVEIYPFDHVHIANWWLQLLKLLKNRTALNIILLAKAKPLYQGSERVLGQWEVAEHEAWRYFVQIKGRLTHIPRIQAANVVERREYLMEKNRFEPSTVGQAFPVPQMASIPFFIENYASLQLQPLSDADLGALSEETRVAAAHALGSEPDFQHIIEKRGE